LATQRSTFALTSGQPAWFASETVIIREPAVSESWSERTCS